MLGSEKRIIIPLPSYGFDPSEAAIPWKLLTETGFEIVFTTPLGEEAVTDQIMLDGKGLGIWKTVLAARKDAVIAHSEMKLSNAFCNPLKYTDVQSSDFDGLLLPGGHDKGVIEYLESKILQDLIVAFFKDKKPVAAICHGVILAARSIDPDTKKSVLYKYKTTALLKSQELLAFNLTRLWMKDYYKTYPITVEDEVKAVLADPSQFIEGPKPLKRDSKRFLDRGFCVKDNNYLSARWPEIFIVLL